ncbi:hypothetical protein B7463_g3034, partial [Scytalidium lignicola]
MNRTFCTFFTVILLSTLTTIFTTIWGIMTTKPPFACGPPPPEAVFADIATLKAAIQKHARENGYAFLTRSSKPNHVVYHCDRAGDYNAKGKKPTVHPTKQRNGSGSKKCGCTMRVSATKDAKSGMWTLKVLEAIHNHMASAAPVAHSAHRIASLDSTVRDQIESLWKSGVKNAQILSVLHINYPDIVITSTDMKNITQSIQIQELGAKTPIQLLLDLNGVFDRLELFWSAQQRGITEAVAQDQLRPKHNVNLPRFAELIGQIHGYALQKLHFEKSMGLPCYHTIWERIKDGGSVRIQDIHLHWLYYRSPEITQEPPLIQVLDPLVIRGKGRPKGALGQGKKLPESNTKRLPSAFELPSSTAPPAVDLSPIPKEQLYILQSTTQIAMARFEQGHIDQYEPGTMRERSYMRGISSVHKDDYMELSANSADSAMLNETQECIEVEVPGRLL